MLAVLGRTTKLACNGETKLRLIPSIIALVLFSIVSTTSIQALASLSKQVEQLRPTGIFGIIVENQEGERGLEVTNTVPLIEGQSYGWVIWLPEDLVRVKWKEVFELPAEPDKWGEAGDIEISQDRKISTKEKEVVVKNGTIQNFWKVLAGDPVGDYVIRVYVNDRLLDIFQFKVVESIEVKD